MTLNRREYGRGTYLESTSPWGLYVGGMVLCSDGKVRKLKRISSTADTFFSIPASVNVTVDHRGVTVAGYVTVETEQGMSTETPDDPAVAKFIAYQYRNNAWVLPPGAWKREEVSVP